MPPAAAIVITTKNRRAELEQAVASALAQEVVGGCEVIVVDDGSTDGTSELIAMKFPQVKLHRFEPSRGYIVQRNFGARTATAPIIFSIDDDAIFSTTTIVADILRQFDRLIIGAVAIPFINVNQDAKVILQRAPTGEGTFIAPTYIGTAHALRREVFLRLGGYREALFHQGEESDYCIRMFREGYVVGLGVSDPIHHFESPRRDFRRVDLYGRRNNILFCWYHAPTVILPGYLALTTRNGLSHGFRVGRLWTMIEGLFLGYRALGSEWKKRRPVPWKVFSLYRELVRRQAVPYAEIRSRLPSAKMPTPPDEKLDARPLQVSIAITTKNRLQELRRTCAVLRELAPAPLEILITADGCTDGTVDFIRAEMPGARLIVHEPGRGSIASRDRMLREAQGDLVLSLDDDSYPQEHDCLAKIVELFEERPEMAVLHFPQCTDEYPETLPRFDFGAPRATRSFSNAGAVLRRATYLQLPGYEPTYFHAYEEPDYALQCVAAGREVFYSPLLSIRHHYSGTARDECRTHHCHSRNEFWSTIMRCPFPQVLLLAPYRVFSQFRYACSRGPDWVVREPIWWGQAAALFFHFLAQRKPVTWDGYRRWLDLPEIVYPPVAPPTQSSHNAVAARTHVA